MNLKANALGKELSWFIFSYLHIFKTFNLKSIHVKWFQWLKEKIDHVPAETVHITSRHFEFNKDCL